MDARLGTRGQRLWPLFGWLLPFWGTLLLWLLNRDYYAPVFGNPPDAFGLPAGLVVLALGAVLACLGVLLGRATRSRWMAALAFGLLTLPATLIAVAAPALILFIINQSPESS